MYPPNVVYLWTAPPLSNHLCLQWGYRLCWGLSAWRQTKAFQLCGLWTTLPHTGMHSIPLYPQLCSRGQRSGAGRWLDVVVVRKYWAAKCCKNTNCLWYYWPQAFSLPVCMCLRVHVCVCVCVEVKKGQGPDFCFELDLLNTLHLEINRFHVSVCGVHMRL